MARIVELYQVNVKGLKGVREAKMDLMVMGILLIKENT